MKNVITNITYATIEDVKNGSVDLALIINGKDLIDLQIDEALEILKTKGLIDGNDIIIPSGLALAAINQHGGAFEHTFKGDDLEIIVDLCFDDESKYIA